MTRRELVGVCSRGRVRTISGAVELFEVDQLADLGRDELDFVVAEGEPTQLYQTVDALGEEKDLNGGCNGRLFAFLITLGKS